MKQELSPTLHNLLMLFEKKLDSYKGESARSYQKAFFSFQYYVIGNYPLNDIINQIIIENWIIDNRIKGLTEKTTSFYLDKVASLYSAVSERIIGGKSDIFKVVKSKLRKKPYPGNYYQFIDETVLKMNLMSQKQGDKNPESLTYRIKNINKDDLKNANDDLKTIWASIALRCGIRGNIVASLLDTIPETLDILDICDKREINEKETAEIIRTIGNALSGDERQWFAMRLRPNVKFEELIRRFSSLSGIVRMPELFYPCEEIATRIGRKIIWKGRPIIRDIVFFKYKITEIYPLFNHLYDLGWCYRSAGSGASKYTVIPERSMEKFKKAIGFLGPGYEIAPAGEMEIMPGDEVIIIAGDYSEQHARILKEDKKHLGEENKIYRVVLLDQFGHWEIGIDARLLKKI